MYVSGRCPIYMVLGYHAWWSQTNMVIKRYFVTVSGFNPSTFSLYHSKMSMKSIIWKSDMYSRVSDDGGAPLASTALYSFADPPVPVPFCVIFNEPLLNYDSEVC